MHYKHVDFCLTCIVQTMLDLNNYYVEEGDTLIHKLCYCQIQMLCPRSPPPPFVGTTGPHSPHLSVFT